MISVELKRYNLLVTSSNGQLDSEIKSFNQSSTFITNLYNYSNESICSWSGFLKETMNYIGKIA